MNTMTATNIANNTAIRGGSIVAAARVTITAIAATVAHSFCKRDRGFMFERSHENDFGFSPKLKNTGGLQH